MNAIEEIKQARQNLLTDEQKEGLLKFVKKTLVNNSFCQIDGAAHYSVQVWERSRFDNTLIIGAPFDKHAAIAEWLNSLGFYTSRYYNSFGVDNGLKVWI